MLLWLDLEHNGALGFHDVSQGVAINWHPLFFLVSFFFLLKK